MPKDYKPTSPSRRSMQGYDFSGLTDIKPLKSKKHGFKKSYGRDNKGHISAGRQGRGGGHKRVFRDIDFKQDKFNIPSVVAAIEYDPNRTSRIARVHFADGEKRYILAPQDLKVGDAILIADQAPPTLGRRIKL